MGADSDGDAGGDADGEAGGSGDEGAGGDADGDVGGHVCGEADGNAVADKGRGGVVGGGDGGGGVSGSEDAVGWVNSVVLMLNAVVSSGSRRTSGEGCPSLKVGGICGAVIVSDPPLLLARRVARLLAREAVTAAFIHFVG